MEVKKTPPQVTPKVIPQVTSSQTTESDDRTKLHWKTSLVVHTPEISDEEIKEMANESKSIFKEDMYRTYFIMGAKWYREQLKKK